jgi:hypothetical protein
MKIALLLAAFAGCLLLFIWQRSDSAARATRDAAAMTGLQAKYDAALQENRDLKQAMQKKAAIRGALATSLPLANRYRALEKK